MCVRVQFVHTAAMKLDGLLVAVNCLCLSAIAALFALTFTENQFRKRSIHRLCAAVNADCGCATAVQRLCNGCVTAVQRLASSPLGAARSQCVGGAAGGRSRG